MAVQPWVLDLITMERGIGLLVIPVNPIPTTFKGAGSLKRLTPLGEGVLYQFSVAAIAITAYFAPYNNIENLTHLRGRCLGCETQLVPETLLASLPGQDPGGGRSGLIWRPWDESTSNLLQIVGKLQFQVVIGLRPNFLAGCQLGVTSFQDLPAFLGGWFSFFIFKARASNERLSPSHCSNPFDLSSITYISWSLHSCTSVCSFCFTGLMTLGLTG